jgi:hypothetical protein
MNALLLAAALFFGANSVPDGTLLFLDNSNMFVELYTGSETTHVAVVLNDRGEPWVYEATPHEVRKLALDDYYAELGKLNQRRKESKKIRVHMVRPRETYSAEEVAAMRGWLESQLGRRYSVKGYVRGQSDGIHCAELAAHTLCTSGALNLDRCQDESPASLYKKMQPCSLPSASITIEEPEERDTWCERSWSDWKAYGMWCKWSSWEAWTFCW